MKDPHDQMLARLCSLLSDGARRPPQVLGDQLGIGLAEVRERLAQLADSGLEIVDDGHSGVRLARRFMPLDEPALCDHLARLRVDADAAMRWSVDSTNSALLREARAGRLSSHRLSILAAEFQSRGRGRQGQPWHGAPGVSLCVSYARNLGLSLGELSGLSLMCGVAVCDVLLRHGITPGLKWPNDVLSGGRKLGGILVEVHPAQERSTFAIIGIGLNVRHDGARDAFLGERSEALGAIDLETAGARAPLDRSELIAEIADALAARLARFATQGFAPFQEEWNRLDAYRDRVVTLAGGGENEPHAIARGVDAQGRLRLDTPGGPRQVVAGEFSLRSA